MSTAELVTFMTLFLFLLNVYKTETVCKSGNVEDDGYIVDKPLRKFGNYRYLFSSADDSLYLLMKDWTSKRTFSNTYSKSALVEMDLKQSTDRIVNLLESAKNGSKPELSFSIGYGSNKSESTPNLDALSKSYIKGYALYISITIDESWFSAQYIFKLTEQERSETDVLHDIIEDMKDENAAMKQQIAELQQQSQTKTGIAIWYASGAATQYIQLNGVHLPPTLKDMAVLSTDKTEIIIGVPGLYRVVGELEGNSYNQGSASYHFSIYLNDQQKARKWGTGTGGFGVIERTFNLKIGDKVKFYTNGNYATNNIYSSFTLQKL